MTHLTDPQQQAFTAAAEAVCRANAAKAAADRADKEAKDAFRALADLYGETTATITDGAYAGAKVAVTDVERTTFDVEVLADLVGKGVFYAVTDRAVNRKQFTAAIDAGRIHPTVADKVTTTTVVQRVTATIPKQ